VQKRDCVGPFGFLGLRQHHAAIAVVFLKDFAIPSLCKRLDGLYSISRANVHHLFDSTIGRSIEQACLCDAMFSHFALTLGDEEVSRKHEVKRPVFIGPNNMMCKAAHAKPYLLSAAAIETRRA